MFLFKILVAYFIYSLTHIMPNTYKQSHNRNVIRKEINDRFAIIKKYKHIFKEHIACDILFYKGIDAVSCNKNRDQAKNPFVLIQ